MFDIHMYDKAKCYSNTNLCDKLLPNGATCIILYLGQFVSSKESGLA